LWCFLLVVVVACFCVHNIFLGFEWFCCFLVQFGGGVLFWVCKLSQVAYTLSAQLSGGVCSSICCLCLLG
jgi:hypothetical protein